MQESTAGEYESEVNAAGKWIVAMKWIGAMKWM